MNSGVSAGESSKHFYWCLRHKRVETDGNVCPGVDRLGPYATAQEATEALARIADREAQWEAEDARWEGEKA